MGDLKDVEPGQIRAACLGMRGARQQGGRSEGREGGLLLYPLGAEVSKECLLGVTRCFQFHFSVPLTWVILGLPSALFYPRPTLSHPPLPAWYWSTPAAMLQGEKIRENMESASGVTGKARAKGDTGVGVGSPFTHGNLPNSTGTPVDESDLECLGVKHLSRQGGGWGEERSGVLGKWEEGLPCLSFRERAE